MTRLVLLVVLLLLSAPVARAATPAEFGATPLVSGTDAAPGAAAATAPPQGDATPASPTPAKRFPRYGYFFLAYAVVWGAVAAYVAYLATRIAAIEARLGRRP